MERSIINTMGKNYFFSLNGILINQMKNILIGTTQIFTEDEIRIRGNHNRN